MTTEEPIANPYVGPRTFTEAERGLFFGRESEARDLLARVLSERLLLFYAQSGAGKSSLLYTRLIPQLQEEKGFVVLPVARVGGELPAGVEQVEDIYAFNLMVSIDEGGDPARLAHVTLSDFFARLARKTVTDATGQERKGWVYDAALTPAPTAAGPGARRYALIIDQFEEIITAHPGHWREREEFFRQLDQVMEAYPSLWVVLTLREDYVAALDPYAPLLTDRMRARFYMERMGLEAALEAIRRPAELGGRPFAPGVAETLRNDLCQVRVAGQEETVTGQYVEPVQLQVVCYQLWENIKDRPLGPITADDRKPGDVNLALIQFYERILADVLAEEVAQKAVVSERQLRTWFDKELITEESTRDLLRQGEETTGSLPNAVVDRLQKRFLVRGETRLGDTRVELVHDRFVLPILQSNRDWFARNLNPLTQAAQAWREANRDPARLYAGSQLAAAVTQLQTHTEEFGKLEQEFVEEGQKTEERRAARRQRGIAWGAILLALVFIALAGWALWSRGQAQTAAQTAAAAGAEAVTQALVAQAARDTAIVAQGQERIARSQAEANATAAVGAKAAAEAASTAAVASAGTAGAERATAQAANTAAAVARATIEANLQAAVTAEAEARQTAAVVNLEAAVAQAVTGTPPPAVVPTVTPTATPAGTCRTLRQVELREGPGSAYPEVETLPRGQELGVLARSRPPVLGSTWLAVRTSDGATGWVQNLPNALDCSSVKLDMLPLVLPPPTPTPNRTVIAQQTQLAQVRATQTSLAVAPPQGRIVFVSNRESREDLYVMNPDGNQQLRWTLNLAREPSYTRGSSLLAFIKDDYSAGRLYIYVMSLGGRDEQRVTKLEDWNYWEPSMAPDGKRIAAASSHVNVNSEILVIDLGGNVVRQITKQNPAKSWRPSWSPDGQQIAYASERGVASGRAEIWVKDLNTDQDRQLTNNGAYNTDPAWSPDSHWIAFISDLEGNKDVWAMDANGGNPRNLTRSPEEERYPVWSFDGNWLAFTRSLPDQEIFLMRADGTQERNLTHNPFWEDWQPVWVP